MNQDNEKTYKYYSLRRPVGIGTCPKNFIDIKNYNERIQVMQNGKMAWGEVTYNRKLTEKEIRDYELLEDISEERKVEALQDINKLDKIYVMLSDLQFKDKDINILLNKMSTVINKEISKQMYKNNISHKEYKDTVGKKYIVELEKEEMIRFYADKIVYDCLTDCSENNRIFTIDEYENNSFLVENFDKIVDKINKDERVCDLEIDKDKKELDFIFYTEYCPHYYQEDLDVSNEQRYECVNDFVNFLREWEENINARWFRTNTREIINQYIQNRCLEGEEREEAEDILKKEIYESGFVDKYIDGYNVPVNVTNMRDLIADMEVAKINLCENLECGEIEDG